MAELTTQAEQFWNLGIKNSKNNSLKYCVRQILANCAEFIDFDKCTTCDDKYILTENFDCVNYPQPVIDSCDEYISNSVCQKCKNGYYLVNSGTQCEKSIDISKCQTYSTSVANTCILCEDDHFVNGGACKARTYAVIANCVNKFIGGDGCELCDLGFMSNNSAQKCLIGKKNCTDYDKLAESVTCKACGPGFYLSGDKTCEKGSLTGCLTYKDLFSCSECGQGYFLKADLCEAHSQKDVIQNCLEFSTTSLNKCKVCDNTAVSYFMSGFCMPVKTIVSGCMKYSDDTTCETCFSSQSYLNGNECTLGTS